MALSIVSEPTTKNEEFPAAFSVTEISNILKKMVENSFSYVRVRGEISGLKAAPSGHTYFSLKDSTSVLAAICWKNSLGKTPVELKDGLEVLCSGRLTTYPGQSKYQLIVEHFEIAGTGALLELLHKRKLALQKEGLFSAERKKKLPFLPRTIGVVTSPTGAVIQDILHRIRDRFPLQVVIWPVLVQGDKAAEQISQAIDGFNKFEGLGRPDVIIVARGGGSIEDLWCFNEEIVVRSTANSQIPIISAVGHETDVTLIDFASDMRAPTPTAAAEMAVPVKSELLLQLLDKKRRLYNSMSNQLNGRFNYLQALTRGLPNSDSLLINPAQRLDDLANRFSAAIAIFITIKKANLSHLASSIVNPAERIKSFYNKLKYLNNICGEIAKGILSKKQYSYSLAAANLKPIYIKKDITHKFKQLQNLAALLDSFHYKKTLDRGFALVRNQDKVLIHSKAQTSSGDALFIELKDGTVETIVK